MGLGPTGEWKDGLRASTAPLHLEFAPAHSPLQDGFRAYKRACERTFLCAKCHAAGWDGCTAAGWDGCTWARLPDHVVTPECHM
eukprot:1157626-Pelagomonas_calceolata.AAC.8